MSKAVLISIKPEWCSLIAIGKKTIEVRKSIPKLDTPFKCYIYCTNNQLFAQSSMEGEYFTAPKSGLRELERCGSKILSGKVIGEFICKISQYEAEFYKGNECYQDIREIFRDYDNPDDDCRDFKILTSNDEDNADDCELCKKSCLSFDDFKNYIGEGFCKLFYGWHISDLKIYDRPKELSEFKGLRNTKFGYEPVEIKRPPQSWQYVECKDNPELMREASKTIAQEVLASATDEGEEYIAGFTLMQG